MSANNEVTNLRDTIIPKSDQLNADQLLGGDLTIRVTRVDRGSGDDQPVVVHYEGESGRPYKPCKSMRKVLIFAWGEDGNAWVGRYMTLYNKRDVKWGGVEVGGIRISHLSDIREDIKLSLAETKGKKGSVIVKRLDMGDGIASARAKLDAAARQGMDALKLAWTSLGDDVRQRIGGRDGCPEALKRTATTADSERSRPEPETTTRSGAQYVAEAEPERVTRTEVEREHERAVSGERAAATPPVATDPNF